MSQASIPKGAAGFGAGQAPPQFTPDQINHLRSESKQSEALAVIITFTAWAGLTVCTRYYTRVFVVRSPGLEDYLIGVAMLASIGMCVSISQQIANGTGLHVMFVPYTEVTQGLRALYGTLMTYNLSLTFIKLSILYQYYRLFVSRYMRYSVYIATAIVICFGLDTLLTTVFTCSPIRAYWDPTLEPQGKAKCLNRFAAWFANGSINIATDIMILLLPMPEIRKLQMQKRQKIVLAFIFGLGWVACIISMVRIYSLRVIQKNMHDPTWYSVYVAYWSVIEANVGIVCACAPALKPLVTRIWPSFAKTSRKRSSDGDDQSDEVIVTIGGGRRNDGVSSGAKKSKGSGASSENEKDVIEGTLDADLEDEAAFKAGRYNNKV